jgi:hypothetical protein
MLRPVVCGVRNETNKEFLNDALARLLLIPTHHKHELRHMGIRTTVGVAISIPAIVGIWLVFLAGLSLHFYMTYLGAALYGFWTAAIVFSFPIVGEAIMWIRSWITLGAFINPVSIWLVIWLFALVGMYAVAGLGVLIGGRRD